MFFKIITIKILKIIKCAPSQVKTRIGRFRALKTHRIWWERGAPIILGKNNSLSCCSIENERRGLAPKFSEKNLLNIKKTLMAVVAVVHHTFVHQFYLILSSLKNYVGQQQHLILFLLRYCYPQVNVWMLVALDGWTKQMEVFPIKKKILTKKSKKK